MEKIKVTVDLPNDRENKDGRKKNQASAIRGLIANLYLMSWQTSTIR